MLQWYIEKARHITEQDKGALIILRSLDPAEVNSLQYINMNYNDIEGKQCEEIATLICNLGSINIDVLKGNKFSEKYKKFLKQKKVLPA